LTAGGWNPAEIRELEQAKLERLDPALREYLVSERTEHTLDLEVQIWLILALPDVFLDYSKSKHRGQVGIGYKRILPEGNFGEATLMNCFFLRFFDFSPHFIGRQIATGQMYHAYKGVSSPRVRYHNV